MGGVVNKHNQKHEIPPFVDLEAIPPFVAPFPPPRFKTLPNGLYSCQICEKKFGVKLGTVQQ